MRMWDTIQKNVVIGQMDKGLIFNLLVSTQYCLYSTIAYYRQPST